MADFVRFRTEDGPLLVNVDVVSCVLKYRSYNGIDEKRKPRYEYSEEQTTIYFAGSGDDYIVVKEPFEDVAAKLLRLF